MSGTSFPQYDERLAERLIPEYSGLLGRVETEPVPEHPEFRFASFEEQVFFSDWRFLLPALFVGHLLANRNKQRSLR
jgi:hypothetical protein